MPRLPYLDSDTPLGEAALAYAREGVPVFPLAQKSKRPIFMGGFNQATTDESQIQDWWSDHPQANIGAVPGRIGCIVPDIDTVEARRAWFDRVVVETASTQTGGGVGVHPWYLAPRLAQRSHWRLDEQGGPFEDPALGELLFRASGGYVVVAPSIHPDTGDPYRFTSPDTEISALPTDIEDLLLQVHSRDAGTSRAANRAEAEEWLKQNSKPQTSEGGEAILAKRIENIANAHKDARNDTLLAEVGVLLNAAYHWDINLDDAMERIREVYVPHVADTRRSAQANREVEHAFEYVATQRYWEGPLGETLTGVPLKPKLEIVKPEFPVPRTPEARMRSQVEELVGHRLDLGKLLKGDIPEIDWLVHGVIPRGRLTAMVAEAKVGKSLLLLDIAAGLAVGAPPFGPQQEPVKVLYVDYEMVPEDVATRLDSLGYSDDEASAALLIDNLYYWQTPPLAPLDTEEGGILLTEAATQLGVDLVIIDTLAAAVEGAENDSDTFRDARLYTWTPLKAAGITVIRADHLGKDSKRGARGSSMKRDDVDLAWELTSMGSGGRERFVMKRTHSRLPGGEDKIMIERMKQPLRHVRVGTRVWASSSIRLAQAIVQHNIPIDGPGRLRDRLKAANIAYDPAHLTEARRYIEEGMPSVDINMTSEVSDPRAKPKPHLTAVPNPPGPKTKKKLPPIDEVEVT